MFNDGIANMNMRLAEAERDYNDRLENDTLHVPTEAERQADKAFWDRLAQERAAKHQGPYVWTGDPMTPPYMRPPFNN